MNKDLSSMSRDELEQNIIELTTQVESQKQKIQWLQEQFNLLQQKRFSASSEKDMADGNQISLFNEAEWSVDEAEGDIPEPDMAKVAPPKKKKTKGGKLRMVSDFSKETIDFRLSEEEQIYPECGEKLTEVRKNIRRELIVIPAQVKVKEYIDAVYACRNCQKNGIENPMHTGRAPRSLLENSLASASFVSDIMKKKFVDGVPVYRQEADLKRKGIQLTKQTMSNWVIRCSEKYLQGVYDILKEELLRRDIIQADETTVQVLSEPGKVATTDSFMWLYRSGEWDPESQIILYEYQANRRQEHPEGFLGDFKEYLQTDGYAGYNSVTKRKKDPAISVGCWAHARRYFVMHQKRSKMETVRFPQPISTKRSPMPTGSLPLSETATWLKRHRRNGCRYKKKKRFLFWMNISSGSEASIRITSSKESSVTGSFTARTRRRHCVHSCLTEGFSAATMLPKGASSHLSSRGRISCSVKPLREQRQLQRYSA